MGGEHNMRTAINSEINGEDALKCKIAIFFKMKKDVVVIEPFFMETMIMGSLS